MKEIIHPPFNFSIRPDLGGTSYDFVKDIGRDKVVFYQRKGEKIKKVEIPGNESFLRVSISEGLGSEFFEGFYRFTGELSIARLYFKGYCEQKNFAEWAKPDPYLWEVYWQMKDNSEDMILEADMDSGKVFVRHVEDLGNGVFKHLSYAESELPINGGKILETEPAEADMFMPANFSVEFDDNILTLGVCTNEKDAAVDAVSAFAISKGLGTRTNPEQLARFLENVFVND